MIAVESILYIRWTCIFLKVLLARLTVAGYVDALGMRGRASGCMYVGIPDTTGPGAGLNDGGIQGVGCSIPSTRCLLRYQIIQKAMQLDTNMTTMKVNMMMAGRGKAEYFSLSFYECRPQHLPYRIEKRSKCFQLNTQDCPYLG
uniref:Putative secreted protein n=1 Tax=Rhipicephalus microplus TaxID=6941 RepID=A0A6G5A0F3_RHIMP